MESDEIRDRYAQQKDKMSRVLASLQILVDSKESNNFLEMAQNYFNDAAYFESANNFVLAFEAIIISWSYVDAGIKAGFFTVPDELKNYFTTE